MELQWFFASKYIEKKWAKHGHDVYARNLVVSRNVLWHKYAQNNKYGIGKSIFYGILNDLKIFKDPSKRTDMCEIFVDGKQKRKYLNERINIINSVINGDDNKMKMQKLIKWQYHKSML